MKRWWKFLEEQKEEPKRKTQKNIQAIEEVCSFIEDDYEYKYYPSVKCYKIYDIMNQQKVIAEVYPQRKKLMCYFKSLEGLDLTKTIFSKDGYKYYLSARVDISYETDYLNTLKEFLDSK